MYHHNDRAKLWCKEERRKGVRRKGSQRSSAESTFPSAMKSSAEKVEYSRPWIVQLLVGPVTGLVSYQERVSYVRPCQSEQLTQN